MRVAIAVVLGLFATVVFASSTNSVDVATLQREVEVQGAKEVARRVYADNTAWRAVITYVQTGDAKWIDVAVQLRGGADGGASSELQDALFAALATNPRHVLGAASRVMPISTLCSGRSDPLPTARAALSEIERIQRAVAQIKDKHVVNEQRRCLSALEDAKTNTKRFFKD